MEYDSYKLNINFFKTIPKWDQAELLTIYGDCIGQVCDGDLSYTLFVIDGFFVEMIQENIEYDVIGINAFMNGPQFNKYLEFDLFDIY